MLPWIGPRDYNNDLKEISVEEAKTRLGELVAEACRGEVVVLRDGRNQVTLTPHLPLDNDSPELEAELLRAIDGPFEPYSSAEMIQIGNRIIKSKRQ